MVTGYLVINQWKRFIDLKKFSCVHRVIESVIYCIIDALPINWNKLGDFIIQNEWILLICSILVSSSRFIVNNTADRPKLNSLEKVILMSFFVIFLFVSYENFEENNHNSGLEVFQAFASPLTITSIHLYIQYIFYRKFLYWTSHPTAICLIGELLQEQIKNKQQKIKGEKRRQISIQAIWSVLCNLFVFIERFWNIDVTNLFWSCWKCSMCNDNEWILI